MRILRIGLILLCGAQVLLVLPVILDRQFGLDRQFHEEPDLVVWVGKSLFFVLYFTWFPATLVGAVLILIGLVTFGWRFVVRHLSKR